jgi:hypothetical protein
MIVSRTNASTGVSSATQRIKQAQDIMLQDTQEMNMMSQIVRGALVCFGEAGSKRGIWHARMQ